MFLSLVISFCTSMDQKIVQNPVRVYKRGGGKGTCMEGIEKEIRSRVERTVHTGTHELDLH